VCHTFGCFEVDEEACSYIDGVSDGEMIEFVTFI